MGISPKFFSSLLLVLGISLLIFACSKDKYEELVFAKAVTEPYDAIDESSVRLSGRIDGTSGEIAAGLNYGFLFSSTNNTPEIGSAGTQQWNDFSTLDFDTLLNVPSGVTHYYRAFAQLGERTSYGDIREVFLPENFQISAFDPVVIYNDRAEFKGSTFVVEYQTELTDHGFVYSSSGQLPTVGTDDTLSLGATVNTGFFSGISRPLEFNTAYQLRAYAIRARDNEVIYSEETISFATTDGWRKTAGLEGTVVYDATGIATPDAAFMGLGCVDRLCPDNGIFGITEGPFWGFLPAGAPAFPRLDNFPQERRGNAVSFSINGKVYYGLGRVSRGEEFAAKTFVDIWEFNPNNNSWFFKDDFPEAGLFNAVVFVLDNKAYIGTGQDETGNETDDFWIFDPAAPIGNHWQKQSWKAPGGPRTEAVAFTLGGKAYLGAGESGGTALSDIWEFDPGTNQWTPQSEGVFAARTGAVAFSRGDKAYLGMGVGDTDLEGAYFDLLEFDPGRGPGADAWRRVRDFPQSTNYPEALRPQNPLQPAFGFLFQDRLFMGGPNVKGNSTDIWEYIPEK